MQSNRSSVHAKYSINWFVAGQVTECNEMCLKPCTFHFPFNNTLDTIIHLTPIKTNEPALFFDKNSSIYNIRRANTDYCIINGR